MSTANRIIESARPTVWLESYFRAKRYPHVLSREEFRACITSGGSPEVVAAYNDRLALEADECVGGS